MKRHFLLMAALLLTCAANAQRLELRFNKEFSNDSLINKTLGAGASFIIDGWHENLDFQIDFDYAGHNKSEVDIYGFSHKLNKLKAGVTALYARPVGERFVLRAGGGVSYHNISKVVTNHLDTLATKGYSNISHTAHALGVGAMVQVQVKVGKACRIGVSALPNYLFPVATSTSRKDVPCDFKRGIFDLQLHIGLEVRLNQ